MSDPGHDVLTDTVPGGVLLRWPALLSLTVLVVNDHVLKGAVGGWTVGGWVTGKASGVAALVLAPLVAVGAVEVVRRRALPARHAVRIAAVVASALALAMALVETVPAATEAYRVALGALRWPLDAGAAVATGTPVGPPTRVVQYADPTDLLTLPAATLPAWWLHRRAGHNRVRMAQRSGNTGWNRVVRR